MNGGVMVVIDAVVPSHIVLSILSLIVVSLCSRLSTAVELVDATLFSLSVV